ncbi:MAG: hypothetical protein FWC16_13065 [Defluviitaleaceae bacterium]|nr:hypothetical protein [Defluviitaleaceae bacterium]MCL2275851.1 hypothetical protein [Defluviitaleaceae bacterium]
MAEIRAEMGANATIVSTRVKPYPFPLGWFMKPRLIVTAAYENDEAFAFTDNDETAEQMMARPIPPMPKPPTITAPPNAPASAILEAARAAMPKTPPPPANNDESIEESLALLLQEARKATAKTEGFPEEGEKKHPAKIDAKNKKQTQLKNPLVQTFYDTLLTQDVLPEVATRLLGDLTEAEHTQTDVKEVVKIIYGNIVDLLSNPTLVNADKPAPQTVVFMGPTGVGKTTTIAKLSSLLTLNHDLRVGLVTADTYRIAAVEQLKTYADILGLDIRTVYKADEAAEQIKGLMPPNDIVLLDTAGRSHKNKENLAELKSILDVIPDSTRYLVLSVTTRYRELANIVNTYASITDFNIVFTKLDESDTLGNLVNLCSLTGKKPAYITFGQSVPEDFDAIKPDSIAKSLLGLTGENPYNEAHASPAQEGGGE